MSALHEQACLGVHTPVVVDRADLQSLFDALHERGYAVVGPTVRDAAIVYDRLDGVDDLPIGWTDEQDGGTYRLKRRTDRALFGYNVGPQAWKRFLHPPIVRLWRTTRRDKEIRFHQEEQTPAKWAFIGARSCELHAIAIQDRIFLHGPHVDPTYAAQHDGLFVIAVNCSQAGGTCFCVSMNTGPEVRSGFDLALTEVIENGHHYFLVDVGTEEGAEVLRAVPHGTASDREQSTARGIIAHTAEHMGRKMDTAGIKALLYQNYEHPRWAEVADRCLSCGNCTTVCPTCFCTTVEDVTDLAGEGAERQRVWASCFTTDFSYIHGGSIRQSPKSRYRQWMTHKLATWIDQFGTSGCVGCGRCITWCPVGIDITEEVGAIRQSAGAASVQQEGNSGER